MSENLCKICSNKTRTLNDEKFELIYYICDKCEFISMDNNYYVNPDEEKDDYLKHDNTFENKGYIQLFTNFINLAINPFKNEIKTVLDFGCGFAPVLSKILKKEGFIVDNYDKYFFPDNSFKLKKYDLITSTEVFEHLIEPIETFKLLKNCLNEKGKIAITTLFHPKDDNKFLNWHYKREISHIAFFTENTIKYIAKKLNFNILFIDNKSTFVLEKI